MKKLVYAFFILMITAAGASGAESDELSMEFGRFGKLTVYRNSDQPSHVVLFVSGDGGWNLGVVDMANILADMDALVVGIDITAYFHNIKDSDEDCVYSAAEFESLSKFVQKKLGFTQYRIPVLVGYSSGATLVYAVMVQAPYNTFQGAISLGFCPSLPMHPALCRSYGLKWHEGPKKEMVVEPFTGQAKPWVVLQGEIDEVCDLKVAEAFVRQASNDSLVLLPDVGHGFSVTKNWMPQFKNAFNQLTAIEAGKAVKAAGSLAGLPLVEVPAKPPETDILAVLFTGDGGWAGLDQEVSEELARRGVSVVGLSTLKYFWTARTPDGAGKDLQGILYHYLDLWKKKRILLMGYSLGADVLPFMASRLPQDLADKTALIVLLGPGNEANFEFHLADWLGGSDDKGLPTLPEIGKLAGRNLLCLYGDDESDSVCPKVSQKGAKIIALPGAHHFNGDYTGIVNKIMSSLNEPKPHD